MSNIEITNINTTAEAPQDDDYVYIHDVSEDTFRKITLENFVGEGVVAEKLNAKQNLSDMTNYVNQSQLSGEIADLDSRIADLENLDNATIYGFDWDMSNSDPTTCISYVLDNRDFTSAKMDYTNDVFDYGSWTNPFFMPSPCMLSFGGTVENYLDPDDYTKNADGTDSTVASSTTANAMMEWPIMYVHRYQKDNVYSFRVSDKKISESYQCWANLNASGEVVKFYTPIYFGSYDNTRLRSISGGTNMVSQNASTEKTRAEANGDGWTTERIVDRWLINDLLVLIGKSTDTQAVFGTGRCATNNSAAIGQGTMNDKGLFWGSTNQTSGVKVFGMENYWGNLWRRHVGWINNKGTQKIKLTTGTQDGSTVTGYNLDGTGYITVANATPAGTSGGYVNAFQVVDGGLVPYSASGTSSTYSCDGLWFNNGQVDYALVGGTWHDGLRVGAFFSNLVALASYAAADVGAAPSYK